MDDPKNGNNPNNDALEQQIAQSNAELEQKRQDIFNARMDILHSQSGEQWTRQGNTPMAGMAALPTAKQLTEDALYNG